MRDLVGSVTRPVKELKGFTRIALNPGEAKRVSFEVPVQQLRYYDLAMEHIVEPGNF